MLKKMPHLLLNRLRLSKPWRYKAPFLIAIPYLLILLGHIAPERAALGILMSCTTILGIAGFGYLLNDFSDREEDRQAGKFNVLNVLPGIAFWALLGVFLAAAVLPWVFYFPKGWSTLGLLGLELGLFALYSLPPFRFKERGWWGVLCDAGYAHAVPAVLAALTFFYLGDRGYGRIWWLMGALGAWQGTVGLRNILLHMWSDHDKDLATGTATLGVRWGKEKLLASIRRVVLPMELIGLALFLGLLAWEMPWLLAFVAFFLLQVVYKARFVNGVALPERLPERMTLWLDDFYVLWFPWFVLLNLIAVSPWFWWLAIFHLLVFRNALGELWREGRRWTVHQRVKYALLGMLALFSGQFVQVQIIGEYYPVAIFPMFSQAPKTPDQPLLRHEIVLFSSGKEQSVSLHDLFPEALESTRATLLRDNLGPLPPQQNQEPDFRKWVAQKVRQQWPENDWHGLRVSWYAWLPGKAEAPLGEFTLGFSPGKGGPNG